MDIGGVDECIPTISGTPDHGAVWSRAWEGSAENATVTTEEFELQRQITFGDALVLDYRLLAEPGYEFVWAWHALIEPEPGLELCAPAGHTVRAWPAHDGEAVTTRWPAVLGRQGFDVLAREDDGTALFCLLPGLGEFAVRGRRGGLSWSLDGEGQPVAMGIWRNLGGFPSVPGTARYRSLGIEPMLGHVHNVAKARPGERARVPASGVLAWRLIVREIHGSSPHR
ncbi:MAG: hypothetical protein M0004_01075 [Actinomycetota bacterium]|nr:hypothetical protein [Actinomycetota bacterium]